MSGTHTEFCQGGLTVPQILTNNGNSRVKLEQAVCQNYDTVSPK